ncbi:hypothetical protein ACWERV_02955 [Streptomyces sp. NPDC004031]
MPVTQPTVMPKYRTDLVTRRLCATVHLDHAFARYVLLTLAEDGLEAVGLPFGVNVVALVRHARVASRRRERRDVLLAALVALQLAGLLLVVQGLSAGRAGTATLGGALAVGALPAGWTVVFTAARRGRAAALRLGRGETSAMDLAPPADPALEQSLTLLRRANFVPYHSTENRHRPFVGSGWLVQKSVWPPIDVGKPAEDEHGKPRTIVPFDASDLHHYLAVHMPRITGLDTLKARNRLYGPGLHVASMGPEVLPDPAGRPLPVVPVALVKTAAAHPQARMETYLCLRNSGEGGFVVLSMHLQAHLNGPRLDWELGAYVLPPLGARYDAVDHLPYRPLGLWWDTVRLAKRGFRRTFYGGPGRVLSRAWDRGARKRELERFRRDIAKGRITYDYGAHSSLREYVADWDRMGYNEVRDARKFFQRLQQGVLLATEKFLEAHHVDTSDFRLTQAQISNVTINGPILGPSQFGWGNTQNNFPPGGPGVPGTPQGGAGMPGGGQQPAGSGAGSGN